MMDRRSSESLRGASPYIWQCPINRGLSVKRKKKLGMGAQPESLRVHAVKTWTRGAHLGGHPREGQDPGQRSNKQMGARAFWAKCHLRPAWNQSEMRARHGGRSGAGTLPWPTPYGRPTSPNPTPDNHRMTATRRSRPRQPPGL